jgi:hypothetical protein
VLLCRQLIPKGQGSQSLAGCREDCVGQRRGHRWDAYFTDTAEGLGEIIGGDRKRHQRTRGVANGLGRLGECAQEASAVASPSTRRHCDLDSVGL